VDIHNGVSGHVETVCLLSKKNAKSKDCVEISVDAEDYYWIRVQRKTFDRLLKFEEYVKKPVE
jgi:hypothetical protein